MYVRPWNAPSKAMIAGRPVTARAIFTAFSTASVPELKRRAFFGRAPGAMRHSISQRRMYGSYGATLKSVWVYRAACSCTARTTAGCEWPTFRQPTPPERSMKVFPSMSWSSAPSARSITAGRWMPMALLTYCSFSPSRAFDFGPGSVRVTT